MIRSTWKRLKAENPVVLLALVLDAPKSPGWYALIGDGRVLYVGCSRNLSQRLTDHMRSLRHHGQHLRTTYGCCERFEIAYRCSQFFGDWLTREYRLIHRLKPMGNYPYASGPRENTVPGFGGRVLLPCPDFDGAYA